MLLSIAIPSFNKLVLIKKQAASQMSYLSQFSSTLHLRYQSVLYQA